MQWSYQARRISKPRASMIRKDPTKNCILLSAFQGLIVVEPAGSRFGDGKVLSPDEANYELQPVWCTGSKAKLDEARKRLGLKRDMAG